MRRLRKTQRRRRQRGGNRKLQVAALVAAISPDLAKSQDLYQLTQTWWNEGGIANSKALADGIVKSIEKASETVTLSVDDIAQQLMREQEKQDHTVHNALTNLLSVVPTELPDYVAYPANTLKPGWKVRDKDGNVLRILSANPVHPEMYEKPMTRLRWIDEEYGEEDGADVDSTTPFEVLEKPEGGKRRRPKQKTLRRKK